MAVDVRDIPESSLQIFDSILTSALYKKEEEVMELFEKLEFYEIAELCKACARIIGIMMKKYEADYKG